MTAGIALGSNIEPRLAQLQKAAARLKKLAVPNTPISASKVYETTPVHCPPGSPLFLNAVLELQTARPPLELLAQLHRIELALGRSPNPIPNAPRPIDLDLLYYDNLTLNDPSLILPHPRLTQRRFVLQPLCDIHPQILIASHTAQEWLEALESSEEICIFEDTFI